MDTNIDLLFNRNTFLVYIWVSFLMGLCASYYSAQGIRGKYEFNTDRKNFIFLCIFTTIIDCIGFLMYKKLGLD